MRISKRRETISSKHLLLFFQQLSTLIAAGVPLLKSLHLLLFAQELPAYHYLIQGLCQDLESGKEFHHALQAFPGYFDPMTCQLIQLGEKTGTLDRMLARVHCYLTKKKALKQQLTQALVYPLTLLLTAIFITFILLYAIVPHFAEIFSQFPGHLPWMTHSLIQVSNYLHQSRFYFLLLFFLSFIYLFKNKLGFHPQNILQKLPLVSKIIKKMELARMGHNLASLLSAALPLTEALRLLSSYAQNPHFALSLYTLSEQVNAGKRFYLSIAADPLYPSLFVQMIKTGEESGSLDLMLSKCGEIYEAELERTLSLWGRLLEPLIIIIVGALIGGIVMAMYLPLFQLGTVI